jgi:peptidoglycan hydrolase FlgJ
MVGAVQRQTPSLPGDITGSVKPRNLEQAAEQFEALFLRSMLAQMRKASDVLGEGNPFDSSQQRMMRDFYDDKLASQLASQRSTGIAQMIISQLSPDSGQRVKSSSDMAALISNAKTLKTPVVPVMSGEKE